LTIKVTHIIGGLAPGGAEMMLYKLLSAIDRNRLEPDVVSLTTEGALGRRIRELGVNVRALGMSLDLRDAGKFAILTRWLCEKRPDVVQTWMYDANLAGGSAAYFAGRFPVVWSVRAEGNDFEGYPKATIMAVKLAIILSPIVPTSIVYNSEAAMRAHSVMGYSSVRGLVIPNGFDTSAFHPSSESRNDVRAELGIDDGSVVIGLVARFHAQKRYLDFVKAAAITLQTHPDTRFLLCGRGVTLQNKELANWITATGHATNFHLLGERADVARITCALDIATSSSSTEAFSNTIGEAMACGIPCVVTDVGDSSLIVGDTGMVVPPRRPELLAAAWLRLIQLGPRERAKMGREARCRIEERYSLPAIASQYERLYEEILRAADVR
jgi:glycosyltransferase involved in cell wall biosynthesis